MKTMCHPGYHHNGFAATHTAGQMMHTYAQVHEWPQSHCVDYREGTRIILHMIAYILRLSCFCEIWDFEIWRLCVSWITYDYLQAHNQTFFRAGEVLRNYDTLIKIFVKNTRKKGKIVELFLLDTLETTF